MGGQRRRLARATFTLLAAVLLIALPASLGAQQRVVVLSKPLVSVTEAAGDSNTDTYLVQLNTKPTGTVTVTVKSDDPEAAKVCTGAGCAPSASVKLTFSDDDDATNAWSTSQTITVTAEDDDDNGNPGVDNPGGGRFTTITHTPSEAGFSTVKTLHVVVIDDDEAGLSLVTDPITDPTAVTVTERGTDPDTISTTTATYTVNLNSRPTGTVTVTVASSDESAVMVTPGSLTFTPENRHEAQRVTVTGVDDQSDNTNDRRIRKIIHTASGGGYDSVTGKVAVTVRDTGTESIGPESKALITVPATTSDDALSVKEAGGKGTYTLRLSTQPSGDVTVTVTSNDTSNATVSPGSLTFTRSNWNTPQTITVTGVNDSKDNDTDMRMVEINHTSRGGGYDGASGQKAVYVDVLDDDTNGIVVARPSVSISESGKTTYRVSLSAHPDLGDGDNPVTVTIEPTGTNARLIENPPDLTFTNDDWNQPQAVTVIGTAATMDDRTADPVRTVSLDHTAAPYFAGTKSLTVTINDNDPAIITVKPTRLTVTESGSTAQYTVELASAPSAALTITTTPNDSGITATDPEFSAGERGPLTVTVAYPNESIAKEDRDVTITNTPSCSNCGYEAVTATEVKVRALDNDTPKVTVPGSRSVREGGTTSLFCQSQGMSCRYFYNSSNSERDD